MLAVENIRKFLNQVQNSEHKRAAVDKQLVSNEKMSGKVCAHSNYREYYCLKRKKRQNVAKKK